MKQRIIYISIPINTPGYDIDKQRAKAAYWQRYFEERGFEVVNPFNLADMLRASFIKIVGREPSYAEYLKEDLSNMEPCTDIFLCCGWTESNGCMEEVDNSIRLELVFWYENKMKLCQETQKN